MCQKVVQSMVSAIALFAVVLGARAGAEDLNLEFRLPTGENPFARYVWLCAACDLADWAAATPAPGFQQVPPRLALFDSGSADLPTPPPGVPPALDFVPGVPGPESIYVARVLGGQILGFDPIFQVLALAQVQRDTRLLYESGTVVHQVTDPSGEVFTLFTFDLGLAGFVDPAQVGALAVLPVPPGWTYSSRVLESDLLVVSNSLASVFVQGGASSWQRHETVPVSSVVRPGGPPEINPGSHGVVAVAVLGEVDFDVSSIDPGALVFGPAGAAPAHAVGGHVEQVDADGIPDLVSHYRVQDTGLVAGDVEACVSGRTLAGIRFRGCSAVVTE